MTESPFLSVAPSKWVASNDLAFAIRDASPVTPGHTLVVPRRAIASWWEATPAERIALLELVESVKGGLDRSAPQPDGFNIGFDDGTAAGQTVDHLHLHVIPRYIGDAEGPRGGARNVIPSDGNVLGAPTGAIGSTSDTAGFVGLTDGLGGHLLPFIQGHLRDPSVDLIEIVVSFVRRSGLQLLTNDLSDALDRGAAIRILTTDYLGITEPAALEQLLDLASDIRARGELTVRVFRDPATSFHPKAFVFSSSADTEPPRTFVGSSNLTRSGLNGGVEWNAFSEDGAAARAAFEHVWADKRSVELTRQVLDEIEAQPRPQPMPRGALAAEIPEVPYDTDDELAPIAPHDIQLAALDALHQTRAEGHRSGLVVMATGLGKTYLAALDVLATGSQRVLFLAHRKEILLQARDAFRRVLPEAQMGMLVDGEDGSAAPLVFASVQSLVRRLDGMPADRFDYIIVDEFHHAWSESYRTVIEHFAPAFLLGLTATPERLDGGDILRLCGDNQVYRCDLVDGIDQQHLSPFQYHGVLDPTDYAVVPWRRGRFDETALEVALATEERARVVFEEWGKRRGSRTLAFCVTQKHADFMAAWFRDQGVRAAAVHAGPTSAPRHDSVRQLTDGELEVLFSVDMFNEGFDVPAIDTVLMLRPTLSPVIFLQQLGRGLRISADKDHLTVIDLIGNHESFLLRPRLLVSLGLTSAPTTAEVLACIRLGQLDLPLGCTVDFDVDVIDLFAELASRRQGNTDRLTDYVLAHVAEEGTRPTKVQVLRAGINPNVGRLPWFEFLDELGVLDEDETQTARATAATLQLFEKKVLSNATRSYKLVTLRALMQLGGLTEAASIAEIVEGSREIVLGDPRLLGDVRSSTFPEPQTCPIGDWEALWRKNPLAALTSATRGASPPFRLVDDRLEPTFTVPGELASPFSRMVGELVDVRMTEYLMREGTGYVLKVSHGSGKPIIRFDRAKHVKMPEGEAIPFEAGGQTYLGDFGKIALNVARLLGSSENDLTALLRGWFGADAGLPGTAHQVAFDQTADGWTMTPAAGRKDGGWSAEQLDALLDHYFAMLASEIKGEPYSKVGHNRELQAAIGRSKGSIEFKFANVSAVLRDLGYRSIDGYKPRDNYQAPLRTAVEARLDAGGLKWLQPL